MTPDNTAVVRRFYDALNARDGEAMAQLVTQDAEFHTRVGAISGQVYGVGDLPGYIADVDEAWEDVRQDPTEMRQLEDGRVLCTVRFEARARASGVETDQVIGILFTLREQKVAHMRAYPTVAEAFEAAGLPH